MTLVTMAGSGNMYIGIPAAGFTNVPGMFPQLQNMQTFDKNGPVKQLPSQEGFLQAANYFLARGLPYSLAAKPLEDLNQPWQAASASCKRGPDCYDPPGQYCRDLKCGKNSFPYHGE